VVLVIGFLLLWAASSWRSRKNFAIAFAGTMAVLLVGAEIILPGWFGLWRQQLHAYVGYVAPPLLQTFLGKTWGITMEAFALVFGAMQFLRWRKEPAGSAQFNYSWIAALSITVLLCPNAAGAKYNQVLLIPVALWLFTAGSTLARRGGLVRITWLVAVNVLLWQWMLASAVSFAAFVLHHTFQTEASWFVLAPELLMFLFPLTIALFVLSSSVPVSPLRPS
jgi:hypothetical protein